MSNTIYIGATLNKDGVFANQIYTSRPTERIEQLKAKYPLIDLLFVSVEEYAAAVGELETAGTARARAFARTQK